MQRTKVILDIDNAIGMPVRDVDDGIALALALASPEIELVGVTTCAGNCHTYESTENTLRLLGLAGRDDIPVAEGRELPFIQDVTANFELLDGFSKMYGFLWKDVPPMPPVTLKPSPLPAHELIIKMVRENPGEVVIVKEGSHTNLALALLVDPEIAPLVKAVIHMGGETGEPDWKSPDPSSHRADPDVWEYIIKMNHTYDPEATTIVIRSGIPFTFVTGEVCKRTLLRLEHVDRFMAVGTPYHKFLADTSRPWVNWQLGYRGYGGEKPLRDGAPMWDPLTLAMAFDPSLCTCVSMRCDTEAFRNRRYPYIYPSADTPQVQVTMDVDEKRFEELMVSRICEYTV